MSATAFLDACGWIPTSGGTGTFAVSAAVQGYQTPASAGAVNATVYSYRAESADKSQWEEGFGAYTVSGTTLARTTITANSLGTTVAVNFSAAPNVFITALTADLQNAALLTSGTLPVARINGGTSSQFVRGDGNYETFAAAKADQIAATSTTVAVVPAVQQNHPSAAKAWGLIAAGSGTPSITAGYNIASVTRTSTGIYVVNFTTAFTSASYAVLLVGVEGSAGFIMSVISQTASSVTVNSFSSAGTSADVANFHIVCFGLQ